MAKQTSKNGKNSKKKLPENPKYCPDCKKTKNKNTGFYKSSSPLFEDGSTPICRLCIKKKVDYSNINTIYNVLQGIDLPFIVDLWETYEDKKKIKDEEGKTYDLIGNYIRQVGSLYKDLGWRGSVFNKPITKVTEKGKSEVDIERRRELKDRWGDEWSDKQLLELDRVCRKLAADKNMKYNSSNFYLELATMNYIRASEAMRKGEKADAEKYTKMFNDTMKMGEFTPSALSKNSNLEKLGGFTDFSLMVEECVDAMSLRRILPEYFVMPRDNADKMIWYNINYMQDALGMKRSSYDEIYDFYIEMEANHEGITFDEMKKRYPKKSTLNDFLSEDCEYEVDRDDDFVEYVEAELNDDGTIK